MSTYFSVGSGAKEYRPAECVKWIDPVTRIPYLLFAADRAVPRWRSDTGMAFVNLQTRTPVLACLPRADLCHARVVPVVWCAEKLVRNGLPMQLRTRASRQLPHKTFIASIAVHAASSQLYAVISVERCVQDSITRYSRPEQDCMQTAYVIRRIDSETGTISRRIIASRGCHVIQLRRN